MLQPQPSGIGGQLTCQQVKEVKEELQTWAGLSVSQGGEGGATDLG